jgi:hypothetical protein
MTSRDPFTVQRFSELLDIRGPELERWPEPERSAGQSLLSESEQARAALERAAQLAVFLDVVAVPEPSAQLTARVLEVPIRHPRSEPASWWPFATFARPLLGLAAATLLGIVTGALVPPSVDELPSSDWDDMSELALGAHLDLEQW